MFFGTLADINGHWRSRTDIGGLRRTRTDIGGLGRTLADSDGLVSQRGGLPGNPCPPMSCPFLDSIRQRTCFFGSLADIDGH